MNGLRTRSRARYRKQGLPQLPRSLAFSYQLYQLYPLSSPRPEGDARDSNASIRDGPVALLSYVDPARTTLDLCDVSQVHHLLFVQKITRRDSRGKLCGFQRACDFIRRPLIGFAGASESLQIRREVSTLSGEQVDGAKLLTLSFPFSSRRCRRREYLTTSRSRCIRDPCPDRPCRTQPAAVRTKLPLRACAGSDSVA